MLSFKIKKQMCLHSSFALFTQGVQYRPPAQGHVYLHGNAHAQVFYVSPCNAVPLMPIWTQTQMTTVCVQSDICVGVCPQMLPGLVWVHMHAPTQMPYWDTTAVSV